MENIELYHQVTGAMDKAGVLTPTAIQQQLRAFTAADWRQAATIFTQREQHPHAFYITDDASGKVAIHNDMGFTRELAKKSVAAYTAEEVGAELGLSALMLSPALLLGGAMAQPELLPVAAVAGVVGAVAAGALGVFEYNQNKSIKPIADADAKLPDQFSFQSR